MEGGGGERDSYSYSDQKPESGGGGGLELYSTYFYPIYVCHVCQRYIESVITIICGDEVGREERGEGERGKEIRGRAP